MCETCEGAGVVRERREGVDYAYRCSACEGENLPAGVRSWDLREIAEKRDAPYRAVV